MRALGLTRRVDDLGRVAIPKQVRKQLQIVTGDEMEVFVDGNKVIFQAVKENDVMGLLQTLEDSLEIYTAETIEAVQKHLTEIKELLLDEPE